MNEPLIHSDLTDELPLDHPRAFETIYCSKLECGTMLHASNNETMTTWVETKSGNYCLPCFTFLDEKDGSDAWS